MNLEKNEVVLSKDQYSNVVPIKKFILYYIFSFGVYFLYWAYKSWSLIKKEKKLNIWVLPRTIFGVFFIGSLGRNVLNIAKEYGYTKTYNSTVIFIIFFLINLVTRRAPEPYDMVYILGFVPLLPIVEASNFYWSSKNPELKVNNKFSVISIILMIIGGLLLSVNFIPDSDNAPKKNISINEEIE
ncbi:MAG: hypothetical protein ACK4IX_07995 [Candidatus Sericytochromatia bacterium]